MLVKYKFIRSYSFIKSKKKKIKSKKIKIKKIITLMLINK